jgi:hypothetical protein
MGTAGAGIAGAAFALPWLSANVFPYLTANGYLSLTTAANSTPFWLTPTTATAIDATLAGLGTGMSLNDWI